MSVVQFRKDDFYLPILRLLDTLGGSASNEEMEQRLIEEFAFNDAELAVVHEKSGTPVIPTKIAWSRSYLKEAGLSPTNSATRDAIGDAFEVFVGPATRGDLTVNFAEQQ